MTKKVFWENPYLTELETRIAASSGNDVILEETIFYALSGGQESDAGTIANFTVLQARKEKQDIIYTLEGAPGLSPSDPVVVRIDWNRRYRLMRLHFAAELVLELAYRHFGTIQKIGAHIGQDKARIDFQWEKSIAGDFPTIKEQASALIQADREIVSAFSDEAAERRYWEINGFARVACGGTHLKRTGEVGEMELKRKNIGKGKERIEIYLCH